MNPVPKGPTGSPLPAQIGRAWLPVTLFAMRLRSINP